VGDAFASFDALTALKEWRWLDLVMCLVLGLAMVTVDTVASSLITQVRRVAPLLGASSSRQNRGVILRTVVLEDNQLLWLVAVLLETLPVLGPWVLIAALSTVLLLAHVLQVIEAIINARHMANRRYSFNLGVLEFGPLCLQLFLLPDYTPD
jgi:hypothetical protein